jgi:hypothetical protein
MPCRPVRHGSSGSADRAGQPREIAGQVFDATEQARSLAQGRQVVKIIRKNQHCLALARDGFHVLRRLGRKVPLLLRGED